MVEGYNRLYAGAYAAPAYVHAVKGMIAALQQKYDVTRNRFREKADDDLPPPSASDAQSTFDW